MGEAYRVRWAAVGGCMRDPTSPHPLCRLRRARRDVPSASGALHGLAIGPMMVPLQAAQYVNPKTYEECVLRRGPRRGAH